MNAKSDEGRIYELENQLKTMHFTTKDDLNLFISEMDVIFNELKKLGREINDKRKFKHLYRALPKEIR